MYMNTSHIENAPQLKKWFFFFQSPEITAKIDTIKSLKKKLHLTNSVFKNMWIYNPPPPPKKKRIS